MNVKEAGVFTPAFSCFRPTSDYNCSIHFIMQRMGEIPTYSQPESYEAPEAMQEQVLQSAQVKSIIDEYEKQGEREKAQAELIVTTIQQKNETSGGKTIP